VAKESSAVKAKVAMRLLFVSVGFDVIVTAGGVASRIQVFSAVLDDTPLLLWTTVRV
jgi:hypothetical protein